MIFVLYEGRYPSIFCDRCCEYGQIASMDDDFYWYDNKIIDCMSCNIRERGMRNGGKSNRYDDWVCLLCQNHNYSFRSVCKDVTI